MMVITRHSPYRGGSGWNYRSGTARLSSLTR
jgi:hypothetical protein